MTRGLQTFDTKHLTHIHAQHIISPQVVIHLGGIIMEGGQRVGMKPGESFKIRLLPREIMVCIAVAELVKPPEVVNLSLAQVVRFALTELCEAAIASKLVPEPNEYDYERATSTYRRGRLSYKVEASRLIFQAQMDRVSAGSPAAIGGLRLQAEETPAAERARVRGRAEQLLREDAAQRKRIDPRKLRFDELLFKSEQDPANMSAAEFKELRKLERAFVS